MKPTIITITGPSCAGKSTLERHLVERGIAVNAISTTTRPMRAGDVQGESYYFVSREGFKQGLALGNFVEHVEFGGNYYGLSVPEIMRVADQRKPIVVVCEPIGQKQIAKYCKANGWKLVSVFVSNSDAVIAERFLGRFANELASAGIAVGAATPVVERYAGRMEQMMTTERAWIAESEAQDIYDIKLSRFDQDTQDWAVDKVRRAICA